MLQQVVDLRAEGDELFTLLDGLAPEDWGRTTPFKDWTVDDVMGHLNFADWLAIRSLTDPAEFESIVAARQAARAEDGGSGLLENMGPKPTKGRALLEQWRADFIDMCELLDAADPDARLKWVGPDMGVRMFTTARQMETWAHGQDVYDLLKRERIHTDRLKNIAVIGVRTFGWTFANRGLAPPELVPYVRLEAPSGVIWEWNEPSANDLVEGSAVEFCRVVTQGRNIADVNLKVMGASATAWMAIAQCFAGPPNDPPAPGARTWT